MNFAGTSVTIKFQTPDGDLVDPDHLVGVEVPVYGLVSDP